MLRTLAMVVLAVLLAVSVTGNVVLLGQAGTMTAEVNHLRTRALTAEQDAHSLQARVAELEGQVPQAPAPTLTAPTPTAAVVAAAATPSTVAAPSVQTIADQVEALRGLHHRQPVPVQLRDAATLKQYLQQQFDRDYLPSERESDQKLLVTLGLLAPEENLAQIELGLLGMQTDSRYVPDDRALYLVGDGTHLSPDAQLAVAGEYTHALQDQVYDLTQVEPKHPANSDQAAAVRALVEGDAALVQHLWVQQYLSPSEQRLLGQGTDRSAFDQAPAIVQADTVFPYALGGRFALLLYQQQGGFAGVDQAFRELPASTAEIMYPDKYRAHWKPQRVQLPDLATALGTGWRRIDSNVLGTFDLSNLLARYGDPANSVQATAGWAGDRWQLLEKDGQQAVALRTVWDTEEAASAFFAAYGQGLKTRFDGARTEADTPTRQALTTSSAAAELRRNGREVLGVLSFDRPSAEALVAAVGGF